MGIVRYLIATAGAIAAFLILGAPAAQAGGCPADQSVLNYKSNDPPYQCAVHYWSSKKSVGPGEVYAWSSDTAVGYTMASKCRYMSSDFITYSWDSYGPSYYAMFTNLNVSTRHVGTGVIFTTGKTDGGQFDDKNNCGTGDGKIKNSIQRVTQGITLDTVQGNGGNSGSTLYFSGTVSPSSSTTGYAVLTVAGEPVTSNGQTVAGPIKDGKYTIAWKTPVVGTDVTIPVSVVYPGDMSACPAEAKTCGSTPIGPTEPVVVKLKKSYTTNSNLNSVSSSSAGLQSTAAQPLIAPVEPVEIGPDATASARTDAGIVVREKSARMPGKLGVSCPSGSVMLHAEADAVSPSRALTYGKRGVQLKPGAVTKGRQATVQLICRSNADSPLLAKRAGFGTSKADRMNSRVEGGFMFGGPGSDRLVVANRKGLAHGGLGNDRIVVRAANGAASGGPGDDTIRSKARGRTLLIGGPGRDHVVATGKALVNVRDGRRDRVVCHGGNVRVLADSLDVLSESCREL